MILKGNSPFLFFFYSGEEDGEDLYKKRIYLLQVTAFLVSSWHVPRHFGGTSPIPSSLKLFDSGQTPSATKAHSHYQNVYPMNFKQKRNKRIWIVVFCFHFLFVTLPLSIVHN